MTRKVHQMLLRCFPCVSLNISVCTCVCVCVCTPSYRKQYLTEVWIWTETITIQQAGLYAKFVPECLFLKTDREHCGWIPWVLSWGQRVGEWRVSLAG